MEGELRGDAHVGGCVWDTGQQRGVEGVGAIEDEGLVAAEAASELDTTGEGAVTGGVDGGEEVGVVAAGVVVGGAGRVEFGGGAVGCGWGEEGLVGEALFRGGGYVVRGGEVHLVGEAVKEGSSCVWKGEAQDEEGIG